MIKSEYHTITPYRTKDGSWIREIVHPSHLGPEVQISIAEAIVSSGQETFLHLHRSFQEIYYFLEGTGKMRLNEETFPVKKGDAIVIPKGTPHKVFNTGASPLRILCCCAPPYTHEETELLESD